MVDTITEVIDNCYNLITNLNLLYKMWFSVFSFKTLTNTPTTSAKVRDTGNSLMIANEAMNVNWYTVLLGRGQLASCCPGD